MRYQREKKLKSDLKIKKEKLRVLNVDMKRIKSEGLISQAKAQIMMMEMSIKIIEDKLKKLKAM